jgi:hypothetical protein
MRTIEDMGGPTPLGAVARGLGAGLVGTGCMTVLQEVMAARKRRAAAAAGAADNGSARGRDPWEDAPAPAQLARRVIEGVLQRDVPPERIPFFTNAVHWGYGTAMGALYGIVQGSVRSNRLVYGPAFGLGVWASSYATLVPLGLYEPPWHYKPRTIAKDISYHLAYGSGVAAGYRLLAGRRS